MRIDRLPGRVRHIGPHEQLPGLTKVRVGMRIGYVWSSRVANAVPSGTIVVHTVMLTHKIIRYPVKKLMPLDKPVKKEINYSGISIIEE